MDREQQGELFSDFKDRHSHLNDIARRIMPGQYPRVVRVSVQGMIVFAIIIMLGFILSFAIGVDTGRKYRDNARGSTSAKKEPGRSHKAAGAVLPSINKPFTIQLCSFTDKNAAINAVNIFKAKGLEIITYKTKNGYALCTGSFATKEEAHSALKRVSLFVNGAFIKKR